MLTEQGLTLSGASVSDQGARGQREPGADTPREAEATVAALHTETDADALEGTGAGSRRPASSLVDLFA